MDFTELLFFTQFIVFIGVMVYKFYRLTNISELYRGKDKDTGKAEPLKQIKISLLLFMVVWITWIVGFVLSIFNYTNMVYLQLMNFQHWLVGLNSVIFIGECIFAFVMVPNSTYVAYESNKQ